MFIPLVHSSDRVNFRFSSHDWPHPFLTTPTPKIFNVILICMNLYQHSKNQIMFEIQETLESWDQICSICYGEIVNLKIMQFDWPRVFGLHLRNNIFLHYRICAGAQQIISIFIIKQIQWKLMTRFFLKFKKTFFWPISPIFRTKKFFKKIGLSWTTS